MQLIMNHKSDDFPTISIFDVPKGVKPEIVENPIGGNLVDIKIGNIGIHVYEEGGNEHI